MFRYRTGLDAGLKPRQRTAPLGVRVPEVIIKVISPGSHTLEAIQAHFEDLQNGKQRALEIDSFSTPVVEKRAARALIDDFDLGMAAWYGYHRILAPKAGETVVVSAASGAVGSVVGQLAKLGGLRAVGIAGGPDKCRYVTDELGFDACVDYRAAKDAEELAKALRIA